MKNIPRRKAAQTAVLLFLTAAVIMLAVYVMTGGAGSNRKTETVTGAVTSAPLKNAGAPMGAVSNVEPVQTVKGPGAVVFRSNEDIRQKYGRIETVTLFTGKTYTGAVVSSTAAEYSIVTVDGVIKVPMGTVKMRVIIR